MIYCTVLLEAVQCPLVIYHPIPAAALIYIFVKFKLRVKERGRGGSTDRFLASLDTVTRLKVKFLYIHRVTPDDNVPRPENVSAIRAWFLPAQYQATLQSPEISGKCCCSKNATKGFKPATPTFQSFSSSTTL